MRKIAILIICVMTLFAVNSVFAAEQPQMNVFVGDINAGETAHVSITLPGDAGGSVTVSVNGHNYQANVVNGQASVDLSGLAAGNYVVKVKYNGAGNYSAVSKEANLKVSDSAPSVNNDTNVNASGEPINASGEKTNATPIVTAENSTNNSTNTTNTTNTTNHTTPKKTAEKNVTVKKPKKEPPKPHKYLKDKNTGLPIVLLLLVIVGVVFGVSFRKR